VLAAAVIFLPALLHAASNVRTSEKIPDAVPAGGEAGSNGEYEEEP